MKFTEYVEVNPKTNLKKGEYAPFVEMANVSITYREPEKIEYKKYTSGPKFQNGDSVVARIEPCLQNGKRFFWKSDKIGFGSTEYIVFRAKEGKMDSKYLFYLLKTDYIKKSMVSSMVGATGRQRVNNDIFGQIEIVVPNIEKQKKIGRTLFLYDDLIENNQKQIKLLEEAAQRLYKEWFVDLRFPGHENTKIVDGVPEGWSVYPFSSKVDIMSGGTPKTSIPDYYNGKIPFYTPKDSDGAFFAYKTQMNITEGGLKNCNSRLYPPKTVIITARGTVGKTTILAVPMAMNQSCYALKMKENDAPYYLFFALNNEIKALQTMANGGVFNTIIGKTFDSINIQIPKDPLIYGFEETVRPFMEQIKNKLQANSKLVEARDRLLPKLMSGEVKV
mgnify:CR=1 FL=1